MTTTREIPNQLVAGTEMTERDCFLRLIDSLGNAHTAARGLAVSRKDMRWMVVANLLEHTSDNAKRLMLKPKGLIIPGRM